MAHQSPDTKVRHDVFLRTALLFVLGALVAGCNGGAASAPAFYTGAAAPSPTPKPIATPTPTPIPLQLYVGISNLPGGVQRYTLPITASSMPTDTIAFATNPVMGLALDANGNLAIGDSAGGLRYFTAPLSGSSVPAASFRNGPAHDDGQLAFTQTTPTMLLATTGSNGVNEFAPPFTSGSAPVASITHPALSVVIGVAVDSAQGVYLSNDGPVSSNIFFYASPATGSPVITPPVATAAYTQMALSSTQLFIGNVGGGGSGTVDVYTLPITAASVPAFSITNGVNGPEGLALDAGGNLYVANTLRRSVITVYAPPFSATSAPVVTKSLDPGVNILGIAIGK